ncbi:uncharacterized protein LOC119110829 [Pollicipes pollicipes]|uniref:uncharacterized protein LOC119110829 n=1 Tax=Pollicipes pollicipes TaxID=41117 RepID=UPI0018858AAE|nr:uncharacterized protein LOC119110829 [Pollicipes pollicipes]
MASLRVVALLFCLAVCLQRGLAIRCHECGRFSKEKGIIEACNKTQTSAADRKECHHTSIMCLKHVNGKKMVKMCTDFCIPYRDEENGGETYCCTMPDFCNSATVRLPTVAFLISVFLVTLSSSSTAAA